MAGWIVDVDARNFRAEVIERSSSVPVVVDFWAEWCGPCKELGPALEKAAKEGDGRFVLAKVDVDRNPELAQAFQVQGIPTVIGLAGGKVVDGFQGALPPAELAAFLDRLAPARTSVADQAREMAAAGQAEEAMELLRAHLRENGTDAAARIVLAELLIDAGKLVDAKKVAGKLDEPDWESDAGRALRARLGLAEEAEDAGDIASLEAEVAGDPEDPDKRIALGKALVAAGRHEAGLGHLLEAFELDPKHGQGAARKAMVEVFEMLGPEDPVANDFRYRLSLLLFS